MNKIRLRKAMNDKFGIINISKQEYKLDEIACIRYGKISDFHSETDIQNNGLNGNESCLFIIFKELQDDKPLVATFGSDWEITFIDEDDVVEVEEVE